MRSRMSNVSIMLPNQGIQSYTSPTQDQIRRISTQRLSIVLPSKSQPDQKSPITTPKLRKYKDIICSLIFFVFIFSMLGSAFYFNVIKNMDKILLIITPADQNRRVCGETIQPDFFAVDYSRMVQVEQFKDFCELSQKVFPSAHISCDLFTDNILDPIKTRVFFLKMKDLNTDLTSRSVGFSGIGGTICVDSGFDCILDAQTEIFCSEDFIQFGSQISGISNLKNQFTKNEFQNFIAVNQRYEFLRGFCVPVNSFKGTEKRNDYEMIDPLAKIGINQCALSLNTQLDNLGNFGSLIDKIFNFATSIFQNFVFEVKTTYLQIIYGLLCGVAITIIYLICLRYIVKILVYSTIVFIIGSAIFGSYYFILASIRINETSIKVSDYFGFLDSNLQSKATGFMILGVFIAIIGSIILIILILCFKGIRVGIAVITSSVDCMRRIPIIFFIPIFFVIIFLFHLAWAGGITLLYYLSGSYDARGHMFSFTDIKDIGGVHTPVQNGGTTTVFAIYVFMTIWGSFFIYSCLEYIISFHVAHWYFSDKKRQRGIFGQSILCVTKNMGTLLVTSFITSLVVFARMVLEYVLRRLELSNKLANSKIIKATVHVARCCLKCLQKIVEWINRNVVIFSAISGQGYFKSLGGAMKLTMGSFFTSMSVKFFSWIFLTFAKLFISIISGVCTWAIIKYTSNFNDLFMSGAVLVSIIMFIVSSYTIGIVQLTIDSIYMCYLYEDTFMLTDRESGGSIFAPDGLRQLLQ
ncbi:Plasma-membrane choline transporter and transmembrane domain-containing protein [Spironucleus salmonicida]|uniref:Choline transporter-like protein n=1 Tax=Spironucleus salmonicida TaxID=348837 RepID=V6LAK0_9EUKA|nr:Plasma-membrane choline transporter and transmembrane domain-containing protein [Spironucleus salmonicida]|eukprot:EST41485.1 Plasma-membrane choline transporter and transmembrane domain-containing protein [Spironucleus salmonicida]